MKVKQFMKKHKSCLLFLFFIFAFSCFMINFFHVDSDYFWHIKAGEKMVSSHSILKHDVFSWYLKGKYWMSHEWLFEVIIYLLKCFFPHIYLIIYSFISIFLLFCILFFTNQKKYLKNIPFSLCWLFLFTIFAGFIQGRPHLFSFVFFACTIWLLYDLYYHEDSKKIFFLPLITIFWANFHGGSSNLSYLFCLCFLVVGLFSFSTSKMVSVKISKKQIFRYFVVMIFCMIATCVNPHGVKMFFYPYQNIFNTLMLNHIAEWQPTVLSNPVHYVYFSFLLFVFLIFLFSKRKIQFLDFVLFLIGCYLGLKSIRFWIYVYFICTYFIFDYIDSRKYDKGTFFLLFFLSMGLIFCTVFNGKKILKEISHCFIDDQVISILQKEQPKRLYNFYDYGGYLIYCNIPVFVDGRADLYSSYNYKDYLDLFALNGKYEEILQKYQFDYFLVPRDFPITYYLETHQSDYQLIYYSSDVCLYKRISL